MLEISKLCRSYGDFKAVDEVSFTINKGEIVGLLGHNGAGKTTIMKMVSGYLEPDAGTILINGRDLAGDTKALQQSLGYLPENLPIYPEMTVADYLDYAAGLKGLAGDIKAAEIRRVVRETDIGAKIADPIATLSRGYKQRVGVAQAILGKPSLLILDEPTNGLDPVQTEHMRELIRDLSENATVIISTHIMQEVDAICDRVLIVKAGRLVIDEKLDALKQSRELGVSTDRDEAAFRRCCGEIKGIAQVSPVHADAPACRYRLALADDADMNAVAGELTRRLVNQGGAVYRLEPVIRNLESLFREVNEPASHEEESTHAA